MNLDENCKDNLPEILYLIVNCIEDKNLEEDVLEAFKVFDKQSIYKLQYLQYNVYNFMKLSS